MPAWIRFQLKERPFYDPRTGEVLASIEGRQNRPNVDPFVGGGKVYPEEALKARRIWWVEHGTALMLLLDEGSVKISQIKSMSGKAEYQASFKEVREYDLSEHAPEERTRTEALADLIKDFGFPGGTTMDLEGKPVLPDLE